MMALEQAVEKLLAAIQPLPAELAAVSELAGRFLAEPVVAAEALPRFDNSAMDGWAVRAGDSGPRRIAGRAPAGAMFDGELQAGECVRVFTGSPLPKGADAVVMQEDAREENNTVTILDPPKPWENVRFRGEDVKAGALLAEAGERVTAAMLGLFSACGIAAAKVHRRPRVAIVATGSELREPGGGPLQGGEIYESNRAMIAALVNKLGFTPVILPMVADELEATTEALKKAAQECDAIITCGGVSVGEYDFVKDAIRAGGGSLDFWRVAIKPGKPFLFASVFGKPLFGLPGNPVSALATFWLLARPALLRMAGAGDVDPEISIGELAEDISNAGDRRHFVRVKIDAHGRVRASGPQASHRLKSLAAANALLDMPPETHWAAGRRVEVLRLET